jgi:D-arabinose 1-dehydrogenase-like Zn-dependent alcohol dehydrogenase
MTMAHEVQGVIAGAKGEAVRLDTIVVPDPGPDEVLVRVQACGVCHTDLHYREGAINDAFPFLLGHEAAGTIESVGENVTNVAPGDFVIIAWRAPCGTCRSCLRGRPWYCFASRNAAQPMTLQDGTPLSPALGIGAFTELTLVAAGQAVKISSAARAAAAGLIGCGIMAGLGAAINTGGVSRGDSVAVIGCGGVGNAAIAGAKLAGAHTVIGVDIDARKLEWAKQFGATHTIDSSQTDPAGDVRAGVLCPRSCRHGGVGRGPQSGYEDRAADDRDFRPRRGGEIFVVWRLSPDAGFPHVDRSVLAGTPRSRSVRLRNHWARRGRRGLPQDGAWRGLALRGRHLGAQHVGNQADRPIRIVAESDTTARPGGGHAVFGCGVG